MASGPTAPLANSNILLIRHAEKPDTGPGLSPAGRARADAYVGFFRGLALDGPGGLDHLFAAEDSPASARPSLTVAPLAAALGLAVVTNFKDKDYKSLAGHLLGLDQFANSGIVICWHHEHILPLAASLGVDANHLPASSAWPNRWPGDVFGWLLRIGYDDQGRVIPGRTVCLNERLTDDDRLDPPSGDPSGFPRNPSTA